VRTSGRRLRGWVKGRRASARNRWRAWRLAAHNRAAATHCFYCGVGFEGTGARQRTVDHRMARGQGGSDGLANLVFACRSCNQRKGSRSEQDFMSSEWLAQRRRDVEQDVTVRRRPAP
jgi:5-methylcytosine-specific restriction endonuclease McrA